MDEVIAPLFMVCVFLLDSRDSFGGWNGWTIFLGLETWCCYAMSVVAPLPKGSFRVRLACKYRTNVKALVHSRSSFRQKHYQSGSSTLFFSPLSSFVSHLTPIPVLLTASVLMVDCPA